MDAHNQYETMVTHVLEFGAFEERQAAARALEATLKAFAQCLTPHEAQRLANELPAPASQWIANAEHCETFGPIELHHRVSAQEGVETTFAMEHAQVALEAMVEAISGEARQWISHRLGDAWSRLLQPRPSVTSLSRRPAGPHQPEEPHTLAEARPGSSHPVSESAPPRHTDSVSDDNPHGDTKISSGGDVHSEPLSSAKPGSKHSLNDAD